jgi:hypothetical protein
MTQRTDLELSQDTSLQTLSSVHSLSAAIQGCGCVTMPPQPPTGTRP